MCSCFHASSNRDFFSFTFSCLTFLSSCSWSHYFLSRWPGERRKEEFVFLRDTSRHSKNGPAEPASPHNWCNHLGQIWSEDNRAEWHLCMQRLADSESPHIVHRWRIALRLHQKETGSHMEHIPWHLDLRNARRCRRWELVFSTDKPHQCSFVKGAETTSSRRGGLVFVFTPVWMNRTSGESTPESSLAGPNSFGVKNWTDSLSILLHRHFLSSTSSSGRSRTSQLTYDPSDLCILPFWLGYKWV